MNVITFPELEHEILSEINSLDDFQLSKKWEHEPYKYRYLLAIYFRNYELNNVINQYPEYASKIQNYYQKLWYFIFDQLPLSLPAEKHNLNTVLITLTQDFLAQLDANNELLPTKNLTETQIRYLPLEYFVNQALAKLYPLERLILVCKDKYSWSDEKICSYLQDHQQYLSKSEIQTYYLQGHARLMNGLPTDIITIYLNYSD